MAKPGPKPKKRRYVRRKARGVAIKNGIQAKALVEALGTIIKLPNVKLKIIIGE